MRITRPYGAEDNPTNEAALAVLRGWAKRHGEEIVEAEILEAAVVVKTVSGRDVRVIRADGSTCKNIRNYLSMYETVGGKRIRVKKTEW